jgi:ATP-dependent Clp protease adapter protein ClpS
METSKSTGRIRKPRRKKLSLYLINDSIHSFEYVIDVLTDLLPMCNKLRAEQIAIITNGSNECQIYTGFPPAIYLLHARLQKAGLTVQIRDYSKTK